MTTQTALKAEIAVDLRRSDLTTNIATAISAAIRHWQTERFYFNESRLSTFVTVADQSLYDVDDDADIPKWIEIDYVKLTDSSGQVYDLWRTSPDDMESLLYTGAATGRPNSYSYFEDSFRLHPIPDAVYTVRPVGLIRKAAPATDDEASNVWMTEAYDLIRLEAEERIFKNVLVDLDRAAVVADSKLEALGKLYAASSRKTATGQIVPTQF